MAAITFYLAGTTFNSVRLLVADTPQTAQTLGDGWVVGTGATLHSELASSVLRASTTFVGTTVPDGTLDGSLHDHYRSEKAQNGSYAAGNWTFTFVFRAQTSATGQVGRVRFRVIKADINLLSPTEITSGQVQAGLTAAMSSTSTDYTSSVTTSLPAFTLNPGEYLYIQIAWERTTGASMTTAEVHFRTGSAAGVGTQIVTSNFTPATQTITTGQISSSARMPMVPNPTGFVGAGSPTHVYPMAQPGINVGQSISGQCEIPTRNDRRWTARH